MSWGIQPSFPAPRAISYNSPNRNVPSPPTTNSLTDHHSTSPLPTTFTSRRYTKLNSERKLPRPHSTRPYLQLQKTQAADLAQVGEPMILYMYLYIEIINHLISSPLRHTMSRWDEPLVVDQANLIIRVERSAVRVCSKTIAFSNTLLQLWLSAITREFL